MTDDGKKPWYLQYPAKLGAVVVFLVALTTLIGNLMELDEKRRAQTPTVASPGVVQVGEETSTAPPSPTSQRLQLQLDRIVVRRDGTVGTTDWRFAVEADDQPLFVLQQDDLDDTGGRNVALPRDAATALRVASERAAVVTVKAWRGSRFRLPDSEPDAVGEGNLSHTGDIAPIEVRAVDADGGDFVLYFSATRDD